MSHENGAGGQGTAPDSGGLDYGAPNSGAFDPRAFALLFAASLTTMANATISPALPGLTRLFADHRDAQFIATLLVPAPSFAVIFCAPLAGRAVDRFGRRGILLAGIMLFAATGSAGLYLGGLDAILISRLLLGIAVAMVMTAQTALLGDYYKGAALRRLAGWQVSARNFGGFAFITLAGWLALMSPQFPFALYALPLLFLPLLWRVIVEPQAPAQPRSGQGGAAADAAAGAAAGGWLAPVLALAALQGLTTACFFLMPTRIPFLLEMRGHDSASGTGLVLGALTLTGGLVAIRYQRAIARFGESRVFGAGYLLMALGLALTAFGAQLAPMLVGAAAVGGGYALVMPNFVALGLAVAPAARRGMVGGILTTSVFAGQVISPFLAAPLIAAQGYGRTYAAAAGIALLLALCSAAIALLRRPAARC